MIEKVNPMHPDKIADRIAGALVDYAYQLQDNPKIAVEVLIGHSNCHIIAETSVNIPIAVVGDTVRRITHERDIIIDYQEVQQDEHLASNQNDGIRCGDNGIFKGMPLTDEQKALSLAVRKFYSKFPTDGKFVLTDDEFIVCQSCAYDDELRKMANEFFNGRDIHINPLGYWTGGINVDSGATNRKLGSDMADGVTGGGIHGKDLSKADVSVNIYAFLEAQRTRKPVELHCHIGQDYVNNKPYSEIVDIAKDFVDSLGGFEKLAEWGLF